MVSVCLLLLMVSGCATNVAPKKEMYWHAHTMNPGEHDFTVLGPVKVEKDWFGVLGYSIGAYVISLDYFIFQSGGVNYSDVLDEARILYPETDAVIDVNYDYNNSVYSFFYAKRTDIVSGIAVKYDREQKNARVNDSLGD